MLLMREISLMWLLVVDDCTLMFKFQLKLHTNEWLRGCSTKLIIPKRFRHRFVDLVLAFKKFSFMCENFIVYKILAIKYHVIQIFRRVNYVAAQKGVLHCYYGNVFFCKGTMLKQ